MSVPWYLMAQGESGVGYKTASGPIVSVNDALAAPLRSLLVNVEPVQEGSGDPSPDNVRPISGWSAVNVWVKPAYDPTANPTATIALGQTVYGGTLDVTAGKMVVDRAMVDMGTLAFVFSPSANRASVSIADVRQKTSWNTHIGLCSCYSEGNISNNSGDAIGFGFYNTALFIRDPRFTSDITTAQIQSLLSGQTLVYELATPIIIPLTPTEISTLQGQQTNVWADTGDVTIEYLVDGGANADLMKLAVAFMGRR